VILIALSLILAAPSSAQSAAADAHTQMLKTLETGQAAAAAGRFCVAAQSFQTAADLAVQLDDPSARSTAALDLAEALGSVPPDCAGLHVTRQEAYATAIQFGDRGQRALAQNAHALFLFGRQEREGAVRELEDVEQAFETSRGKSGITPRDMAVYQYNLAKMYEDGGTSTDFKKANEEYKKSLRNRPDYADAAADAFSLLNRVTDPQNPNAIQGAEVATLMIEGGQANVAADRVIGLLEKVVAEPDTQVLLGALLRAYLALPLHARDHDMVRLNTLAETLLPNNRALAAAIKELEMAYSGIVPVYHSEQQAAKGFSAWIRGPSSVVALAKLLHRRGESAERLQKNTDAVAFYSAAWYLDPANTQNALQCAALLQADPSLPQNHWLPRQMLATYLPEPTWFPYVTTSLIDAPERSELRLEADDWGNVARMYRLLEPSPREDMTHRISNRERTSRKQADAQRVAELTATEGDRVVSGSAMDADVNAVDIEVKTSDFPKSAKWGVKEIAVVSVDSETHRYSAILLNSLAAGERVTVYTIQFGNKSTTPFREITVARRHFGGLRHVHAFFSAGSEIAKENAGTGTQSRVDALSSFTFEGVGSFRLKNHGQPFLPSSRYGYLISPYASFLLAPFALPSKGGAVTQVGHAQSLEGGAYIPLYSDFFSWFWQGSPYSLFVAPIGTLGFHTAGEDAGRMFYKYGSGGLRLGSLRFARYGEKVPELRSHVDVTVGKWQNLTTFMGNRGYVPTRLEVRGQFGIPATSAYVGFLQTAGPGPNDSRILIGLRLNLTYPLSRLLRVDQ
jgi:tetratricopeptide (TPR) repeat protein